MEKKHIKNPKAINQTVNQTSLFHCGTLSGSETQGPEGEDRMSSHFLHLEPLNLNTCGTQLAHITTPEE